MDGVIYAEMSKADQRKVRRQMLEIADKMLRECGSSKGERWEY